MTMTLVAYPPRPRLHRPRPTWRDAAPVCVRCGAGTGACGCCDPEPEPPIGSSGSLSAPPATLSDSSSGDPRVPVSCDFTARHPNCTATITCGPPVLAPPVVYLSAVWVDIPPITSAFRRCVMETYSTFLWVCPLVATTPFIHYRSAPAAHGCEPPASGRYCVAVEAFVRLCFTGTYLAGFQVSEFGGSGDPINCLDSYVTCVAAEASCDPLYLYLVQGPNTSTPRIEWTVTE